jgi:integrase
VGKYGRTYKGKDGLSLTVETEGGPYVIRWTDKATGKSKRRSTGTNDFTEACEVMEGFWTRQLHEADTHAVLTVGDVLDGYEKYLREHHKHRSNVSIVNKLRRFWSGLPVSQVTGAQQKKYEEECRRGLHSTNKVRRRRGVAATKQHAAVLDSSLSREIVMLNAAGAWAAKADLIPRTQQWKLMPLPMNLRRPSALTTDEANELMTLAAETSEGAHRFTRIHRFVWIACLTGVRCEAIETLRWDQIDFTKEIIDFRDPTKRTSNKRRPVQPISARLLPLLRTAYDQRITDFVLDHKTSLARNWVEFRATTPWADADLHRHDLRAAAITSALDKGMPVAKATVFFGVTIGVIERFYLRPSANFLNDVKVYI